MTHTYRLSNIRQAIEIGTTLSKSWFRGHPQVHGNLTPKIFRPDWDAAWALKPSVELQIIDDFRRRAPGLVERAPDSKDLLSWLFLMQHHGAPTRLLDWTESALVALYFVVAEHQQENGELWVLVPELLNDRADIGSGFPLLNNGVLNYLVEEPNHPDHERHARARKLPHVPLRPIALRPATSFPRMVAQLSTFTIHPKPTPTHTIPEILPEEQFLVRYVIPAAVKHQIMNDLQALGIGRRTLFPDLDGLSETLRREHWGTLAYTPPAPPKADGPWQA